MANKYWVLLHPQDNVAIITHPEGVATGTVIDLETPVTSQSKIQKGHKVAIRKIEAGKPILKFGHTIGLSTVDIQPGEHVHVHNVAMPPKEASHFGMGSTQPGVVQTTSQIPWETLPRHFSGYLRDNGQAGIRNYIVVVASVNCSATVVKAICRHFGPELLKKSGLDGIVPVTHSSGCAQAIGGLSYQVLNRTLAGWVFHPNVVGAVIIGLGCEGTTFKTILEAKKSLNINSNIPLEHFSIQDVGGTADAIEQGIRSVNSILEQLPVFERTLLPVSHLKLALNCGGSDSFSSLTANPALGVVSDILVSKGGTVDLAEIPECTGAEDLLYFRAASEKVRLQLESIFAWWQDYALRHKITLNENLAPGNISGGITTIIEKSLGAVAKAGSSPLTQVVEYAEPITEKGFTLMNTPGFDPVSVTGLVAGSCNVVAFTTGRGSVYGCSIAPTIKIATTSDLFRRMKGDMDVDAGIALEEGNLDPVAITLYQFLIAVANGEKTWSEKLGLGWEEFAPWPIAETL